MCSTCSRVDVHHEISEHGIPSATSSTEQQYVALWLILASVRQVCHQMQWFSISNKVILPEDVPLKYVGVEHHL